MANKHSCWAKAVYDGKNALRCSICGKKLTKPIGRLSPRLKSWEHEKKKDAK